MSCEQQGPKHLDLHLLSSPDTLAENWMDSEVAGIRTGTQTSGQTAAPQSWPQR